MAKVLIVYYSRTGNTEAMATAIANAVAEEGLDVVCKKVKDVAVDELLEADGLIVGSPTYYGTMAAPVKQLLDASVKHHKKLDGKVGAAFATAESMGQETTLFSILQALLIHGMIIQGDPEADYYGVTSIEKPDEQVLEKCQRFGQRFATLVKRVASK
ncbi:MAG: NAD(P)H-dependent oxidoreductase [Dehalococcoidia bacterium]|nr:NAD(P)H-dependent oxidoreductase [Dehalococcoidia bacterium]RLC62991.1 MAG: flavodoxin family protein [Chloroflexota bacterium]HFB06940.1 flavodoxin family protein [Chloroflexota bacterium]